MSETTVASLACQRVTYSKLNGHLTDPISSQAVPVVDQPAENQAFPYVQLCAFRESLRNTFNHTGRAVNAQIDVWTRSGADSAADGWYQARAIAGQIDVLMDGAIFGASDGWTFVDCQFQYGHDQAEADAITRRIILEYEFRLETTTP